MRPDDDLQRRVATALHTELDGITPQRDLLTGAVGQARRIRRLQRTGVTLASVAAALAVATPIAWATLAPPSRPAVPGTTGAPAAPSPTGQSATATSNVTGAPAPPSAAPTHTLGLPLRQVVPSLDAPTAAPDVPYLHGHTVHDGTRTIALELPERTPVIFVGVFADGTVLANVLTARADGVGVWDLVWFDGTGAETAREPDAMKAVLDSAGGQVAWVDEQDRIHLSTSRGTEVATWPQRGLYPTGVADGRVYANDTDRRGVVLDSATGTMTKTPGLTWGPVHAGSGVGIARPMGQPGPACFQLVDLATSLARWTVCGDVDPTGPFSADGRFLVAVGGPDGDPQHQFTVLRALDGQAVLGVGTIGTAFSLDGGKAVNAGGTAVTMVATTAGEVGTPGRQALLRCPLDGNACSVVGADEAMPTDAVGNPASVWAVGGLP